MNMKTEHTPKGAGRKPLPEHLRKVTLHNFRLPKWMVEWLLSHKGKGSQLLEEAVVNYFHLRLPEDSTMRHKEISTESNNKEEENGST